MEIFVCIVCVCLNGTHQKVKRKRPLELYISCPPSPAFVTEVVFVIAVTCTLFIAIFERGVKGRGRGLLKRKYSRY